MVSARADGLYLGFITGKAFVIFDVDRLLLFCDLCGMLSCISAAQLPQLHCSLLL